MKVTIIKGYDLRTSMGNKYLDISTFSKLTVFVNNAHTLCHVMAMGDSDSYLRIKLPAGLKGTSDQYLANFIQEKLQLWVG